MLSEDKMGVVVSKTTVVFGVVEFMTSIFGRLVVKFVNEGVIKQKKAGFT